MTLPSAPNCLDTPHTPTNFHTVADQLSRALGPYPVILRRNGLLRVLYASVDVPSTAVHVGFYGGPRFQIEKFTVAVLEAVMTMGPHHNGRTLVTLLMRDGITETGATLTSRLAIGRENTETVLNRMRRLTASGLVRRVTLPKDLLLKRPHEIAWGLTEAGERMALDICRRHGWEWRL